MCHAADLGPNHTLLRQVRLPNFTRLNHVVLHVIHMGYLQEGPARLASLLCQMPNCSAS
jgi:hypothetical protein